MGVRAGALVLVFAFTITLALSLVKGLVGSCDLFYELLFAERLVRRPRQSIIASDRHVSVITLQYDLPLLCKISKASAQVGMLSEL